VRFVFGEFEFDLSSRQLLRHGSAIQLSPKAFQLLALLLERRPEAVSKTELLRHLWSEAFVSEASLYNLVAEVRAALGDGPRAARFIRTVPRYGYAFHGDARPAAAEVSSSHVTSPGPRLVSKDREWALSQGSNLLGRDGDCGVRIDHPSVSRRHACISVTGGEATVEDLDSKNGTSVNGQPVTSPVVLKDLDRIRVGSARLVYRTLGDLLSTVTQGPV
jgi:DNA-binding winged helix-turn-helix (wHTH) protein